MVDSPLTPEDLIKEKRLWQIFRQSLALKSNKFNLIITGLSLIFFCFDAWRSRENYVLLADFVRGMANLGLTIGFSILAFLIAGFTVFATMTERSLFEAKALTLDEENGMSFLKSDMFLLMRFFCYMVAYIAICLLIFLLSRKGGLVYSVGLQLHFDDSVRSLLVSLAYVAISSSTVFVLMQIKSFIFNVYHLIMSSIVWGFKNPKKIEKE